MGTRGIQGKEPDPRIVYADIIDLPHHQSATRKHMSLYDRAAQFAPFAALTGYDDMIEEEARVVDSQAEPGEEQVAQLNRKLCRLAEILDAGESPEITVTWFEPDPSKQGGSYCTACEKIKKIDRMHQKLVLARTWGRAETNVTIELSRISELQGDCLLDLDDEVL